jgi:hypothetical protein
LGPSPGRALRAPSAAERAEVRGKFIFIDKAPDCRDDCGEFVVGEVDCRHGLASAAAPGVVLCVADGIVRIVVLIVAGEDLGGRLRREIDLPIGIAAGERERRNHDRDAEPHGRFRGRPVGRSFGRCEREVGHQVLPLPAAERVIARVGDLIEQRTLNFNSMCRQERPRAALSARATGRGHRLELPLTCRDKPADVPQVTHS